MQTAPESPPNNLLAPGKIYRCGTLSYTARGLIALFAWMLWGDVCFTLMEHVVPSILPLRLRSLDSPNMVIGFIMTTLPGIFNIGVTPLISFKSDRHRSRWGRRIPFILYTLPFLTLTLILIGYDDSLGRWVKAAFLSGNQISEAKVIIILLAIFAAMFDFFNMFVNTVYWYLFNDVVPKEWMGRFMSWFRLVGTLTGLVYNYFIFQYAESHMRVIFFGAAVVYFIGFGIMLLRIKEGEYPPLEDGGKKQSLLDNIRTYARECYTMRFYWDIFLNYALMAFSGSISVFQVFFMKSLGLNLGNIGKLGAIAGVTGPICLLFAGHLVDRWHAVRVAAYIAAYSAFLAFGNNWVWLCIDRPPTLVYMWISILNGAIFATLLGSISSMIELPRMMALFPKDRFGQFSGAIALLRAPAAMAGGLLAGAFMDLWKHFYPVDNYSYRFMFLWTGPITVVSFYFHYRVFRSWKRLGGEKSYVAPSQPFRLADLPPHPEDTGKVERGMLWVVAFSFTGILLSSVAWWAYYTFWELNRRYAMVFLIAAVVQIVLFAAYLRFIKFMERP